MTIDTPYQNYCKPKVFVKIIFIYDMIAFYMCCLLAIKHANWLPSFFVTFKLEPCS